jgi:glycosyltransferase involved in cell wall biosynthesis
VDAGEPAPAELARLPRPLAGYVGAINAKLDLTWLDHLAAARPDWSLALVGPVDVSEQDATLTALRGRPNVHFFGQQPAEAVPRYINGMDVCLLPYKRNEWTRNISSLKLYEYLACGKPAVCSDVPAARQHAELVAIAGDADAFVQLTEAALAGATVEAAARRRALAAQNTWRQRVEQISALLQETLRAGVQRGSEQRAISP